MSYRIVPIAEEHIAGFHAMIDSVFREARMHAFLEASPIEQVAEFVRGNIRNNEPQFVALAGERVIGWCDVLLKPRPAMRHSGTLGIGLLRDYRGQGVGKALMETTLDAAKARGLTRIELTVRTDNERAKRLYEKFGFVGEGLLRNHIFIDGAYRDSYLMALLNVS